MTFETLMNKIHSKRINTNNFANTPNGSEELTDGTIEGGNVTINL